MSGYFGCFEDVESFVRAEKGTEISDRDYTEGIIYGCYLCEMITMDEKYNLYDLLTEVIDNNIERLNNGGEEVE